MSVMHCQFVPELQMLFRRLYLDSFPFDRNFMVQPPPTNRTISNRIFILQAAHLYRLLLARFRHFFQRQYCLNQSFAKLNNHIVFGIPLILCSKMPFIFTYFTSLPIFTKKAQTRNTLSVVLPILCFVFILFIRIL